jgi:hypothetical protein
MPTDEEQDLLRAMLLTASAGLDSMVKQLIRDALPQLITSREASRQAFKAFVERRLRIADEVDHKLLADVLAEFSPRDRLISLFVADLTSRSLQSKDELFKVGAAFDIPSRQLISDPEQLIAVFQARNQMAHEMDVDFTRPNRTRRPRARDAMVSKTNLVFDISNKFLLGVDRWL